MFTHTIPGPAPGAGVLADGAMVVFDAAGEGAAVVVVVAGLFDLNQECFAGVGETAGAGDVAAVVAAVSFFLCLGLAEASGLAAGEGDVAAVVAAASFFLCFGLAEASGLAAGEGDCASNEVAENPINVMIRPINLFMTQAYESRERGFKTKVVQVTSPIVR